MTKNNKDFTLIDFLWTNSNSGKDYLFKVREETMDDFIVAELIQNDVYKLQNMVSFVCGEGEQPKVIVDLGAHIGGFTVYATSLYPDSKIYAYEACKDNFGLLKLNVENSKYNLYKNIKVENAIVCGKKLPTELRSDNRLKDLGINTGGRKFVYGEGKPLDMNYTTLPEIIESNSISCIDVLKMDIEGSEYQVLEYMKEKNMLSKIKCLICELHVSEDQGRPFYKFLDYLEDFKWIKVVKDQNSNTRLVFAIY